MNLRKTLFSSASAVALACVFSSPASAATCTATDDASFDACVAGAANGDTIVLTGAATLDTSITASNLNLTVNAGGSLTDAGGSFGTSTAVTVNSGGSLATSGADTFASLSGAGTITTSTGGILFGDAGNTAFSGSWSGVSLSQYLFKQGTGTLTINGMTSVNGEFGSTLGTVVQSSGNTSIKSIQIGTGATGNSTMNVSGGTLNLTGTGGSGAPCASQCPALRVGDFGGTGIMNQTGGSIVMGVPGGSFNIGNQGGIGTYNLSGGTLQLGVFGDVTSEGLHSIGRSTTDTRNSQGTLNISGTGLLDLQRGFLVNGDRDAGGLLATTSSTINQTGGTLRVRDGAFFYLSAYNNAGALDSVYNLNGGTLEIGGTSLQTDYTGGTGGAYQFNIGNGTIKVIDNALTVAANATLTGATAATGATIDTNGLGATWTGNLSGTGWLSKAGAGTLTLSGTNTFSGGLAINAGTVATTGTSAIGDTASVSIGSGGTLALGAMAPGAFELVGGLSMASGSTLSVTTAGTGLVVGDLTNSSIAGTVLSPFGGFLAKAGPATMTINGMTMAEGDFYLLGGTTAHTGGTTTIKAPIVGSGTGYSAIFTMSGGTLNVTGTCVLPGDSGCARMSVGDFGGTGVVNHTGGTIKVAGTVGVSPASFVVGNQGGDGTYNISGGVLQFGDAADAVNSGIWGVGRSTASATDATTNGTLNISGTGLVDVQTGDLVNGDRDAAIRAGGETTVSTINMTGGELRVRSNGEFFLAGFNNNAAVDSIFNLNGGQLTIGGASLQEYYAGGTGVYQFNFGSGMVMVSGSALTTTANATLTGATAATGGTINTNGLGANWNGVLSGSGWLVKAGAGTLNLGGINTYTGGTAFNGGTVFADAVADLGALSAGMSFNGGTLQLGVADLLTTRTGATALAGAGTIDTNGFNTGYAGAISGTGSLTKAGAGTLTLSGANTYGGATTISTGTLATSGGSAIGDTSAVTVASGATLSLGGNETVGSLAGAGSVALAANTLTAGGNNGSTSFTGTTAGTGGLTKAGTGTMSTGNLAHTGLTTVNGGTFNVNGSVAGSVVVNSGGTLSGNTAIAGNLTLNAGGALSSGNSPGTTTVAGNFVGGGLLNVEVQFNNAGAPVNGTTHDFLNITGNVTGVSTINVLAVAPSTAPTITTGNGIELVRVGGTTSAGAFVLGGPVVQGGIQYLLNYLPNYSGTLDGYFLQATARDEIAGHVAILSAGRSMLARCNRGDERFNGPIGAGGKRAWAKFLGGSVETGADTGLQTDQEFSCTAGGMDLASAGDLRLGLAGGFGDTSVDVTTVAGVSKIDGDQSTIEAQASYAMGSTFVNMTAGYASTDWTHTGPVSGVKRATVDGLIGSLQVGQRWSLGEAWQVGLSGGLDYDGTSCTKSCLLAGVTADESNWRGNVAAKLSGTAGAFRPFASIAYSDDLDGGNAVSLGGVSVAADTASSLLTARAGFDARLNEKVGLFIDAGMVEGLDNDVTGYDGQAGLRINW